MRRSKSFDNLYINQDENNFQPVKKMDGNFDFSSSNKRYFKLGPIEDYQINGKILNIIF
jgi:hypothetical protein